MDGFALTRARMITLAMLAVLALASCETVQTTQPGAVGVERQQSMRLSIVAAAGIGVPQRFFDMLTAAGLRIEPLPLPDHFDYRDNPFTGRPADLLLITEKDAVKCRGVDALRNDPRIWVVPLQARLDAELVDLLVARLNLLRKNPNGSPVA
jgi:tetraacyldisaccharide 4'-kinase